MTHEHGISRVKGLQKDFLNWVEEHPHLGKLDPERLNKVRGQAFRSTFVAFKSGRVGIKTDDPIILWKQFFAWATVAGLPQEVEHELQAKCLRVSLEAFRIGALVTGAQED